MQVPTMYRSHTSLSMERFFSISSSEVEMLTQQLDRAAHYCQHATSSSNTSWHDEPTASYPGASGYAGATARTVSDYLKKLLTN